MDPDTSYPPDFVHSELVHEAGIRQIRLLRRSASQQALDILQFDLVVFNIDAGLPEYVALSYTWGDEPPSSKIIVNDGIMNIRQNLHDFLRLLSVRSDEATYIWIDQICINQNSVQERNHQAQMMSLVYGQALKVIIWLGRRQSQNRHAIEILGSGHESWQKIRTIANEDGIFDNRYQEYTIARNSITQLLSKPYWSRLWIVQEIVLAQEAEIWCGNSILSWNALRAFCEFCSQPSRSSPPGLNSSQIELTLRDLFIPSAISQASQDSLSRHARSFGSAVITYCSNRCTDPRDKVFGLQGMILAAERMEVDYTKSVEEVFVDAAIQIARKSPHYLGDIDALADSMSISVPNTRGGSFRIRHIATRAASLPWAGGKQEDIDWSVSWLRYMLTQAILGHCEAEKVWLKGLLETAMDRISTAIQDHWLDAVSVSTSAATASDQIDRASKLATSRTPSYTSRFWPFAR